MKKIKLLFTIKKNKMNNKQCKIVRIFSLLSWNVLRKIINKFKLLKVCSGILH